MNSSSLISSNSTNPVDFTCHDNPADWKIVVTNTGDCVLYNVSVSDDNDYDFGSSFTLQIGESIEFDYRTWIRNDTINCAEACGEDVAGNEVCDEDCAEARM